MKMKAFQRLTELRITCNWLLVYENIKQKLNKNVYCICDDVYSKTFLSVIFKLLEKRGIGVIDTNNKRTIHDYRVTEEIYFSNTEFGPRDYLAVSRKTLQI